jgi:hypothetical protein
MSYFLLIFSSFILVFNIYLINLYLLKYKKEKNHWDNVNNMLNDFDYFQFVGGPCDGEYKFLQKEKNYVIYRKVHHYTKEKGKFLYKKTSGLGLTPRPEV